MSIPEKRCCTLQRGKRVLGVMLILLYFAGTELQHEDASADICAARSVGAPAGSPAVSCVPGQRHFEHTYIHCTKGKTCSMTMVQMLFNRVLAA